MHEIEPMAALAPLRPCPYIPVFGSVFVCTRCKMAIHIKDKGDFESKLSDAGDNLVVVDFYATWCGPCKMISPKLEELAFELTNVLFLKVDVDECEDLTVEYNIMSMPTFVFIKNKQVLTTFSGAHFERLSQLIQEHK